MNVFVVIHFDLIVFFILLHSGPPAKLKKEDSTNTKLRKAIAEIKSTDAKKVKKYKPDNDFTAKYSDVS